MSAAQTVAPAAGSEGERIDPEVWRVVAVLILGAIMSVLDTSIVNVALEDLSRDLDSSLGDVQWVVSGYLLALAAVIPATGWASRRIGPKRLYLWSLFLFTVGSALCGLANSIGELIFFRVLQGLGGGMVLPVGQMMMVRVAGPRHLPRVMSAFSVAVILAPVLGPTVGGLLLDSIGWRWIFFVNVPIGVVAVFACLRRLPSEPLEPAGRFDLLGLVLAGAGLVGVTYGLAEAGSSGDPLTQITLPLVLGGLLVAAFVVHALRTPEPLLDMRLYASQAFSAASLTIFSLGAVLYGSLILMPLYFQTVRHEDAVVTGLLLMPRGIGAAISSPLSGRLTDRIGAGVTAACGGVISFLATIPFLMLGAHTSYVFTTVAMVVQGFGLGLCFTPTMAAAYRALRPEQVNDAAPQQNIIMRVGGSIGTAILAVVLQHQLSAAGESVTGQANAFGSTFWWVLGGAALAVIPMGLLIRIERRLDRAGDGAGEPAYQATPQLLEAE